MTFLERKAARSGWYPLASGGYYRSRLLRRNDSGVTVSARKRKERKARWPTPYSRVTNRDALYLEMP